MNKKKSVLVLLAGTNQEFNASILPGTTAKDLLEKLNISGTLRKADEAMPFGENEDLYARVDNGEKLIAAPKMMVAGR